MDLSSIAAILNPYVGLADDGLKFGADLLVYLTTKLQHDIANEIDTLEDERKALLDRGNPNDILRADIITGRIERKTAERERVGGPADVPPRARPVV